MPALRVGLLGLAAACLVAAVAGGLARLGVPFAVPQAAAHHGLLMAGGFLGTVISLERAIALGRPYAYASPLAAGVGAALLVAGVRGAGLAVSLAAPAVLLAAGIELVRRQPLTHIVLLLVASACWLAGDLFLIAGAAPDVCAGWWFAFLVLTVAAERLEMTRLVPRPRAAHALFQAAIVLVLGGAALQSWRPVAGGVVFGAGLVAVAVWCAAFDLARRTVRTREYARYAALALLLGYAWLAVGGFAWAAMSAGRPEWRDAALHAVGLGFVFSMVLAHAPLVVPVVARRSMRYTPLFYAPLALLHASLVVRLAGGAASFTLRRWGGILDALALLAFAGTLAFALGRSASAQAGSRTTDKSRRSSA